MPEVYETLGVRPALDTSELYSKGILVGVEGDVLIAEVHAAKGEKDEPRVEGIEGECSSRPVEGCGSRTENWTDAGRSKAAVQDACELTQTSRLSACDSRKPPITVTGKSAFTPLHLH